MKLVEESEKKNYKNVWTLSEIIEGTIHSVSYELLGVARSLADARGCEVWTVVLGKAVKGETLKELISYGADRIIVMEDPALEAFNDELECAILERLVRKYNPEILLGAATTRGRALIPRLAGSIYAGLTADCTQLEIDPETGDLLQTRPAFGGNIMATIRSGGFRPQMATVRPKVMKSLPPDPTRQGTVIREKLEKADCTGAKEVLESVKTEDNAIHISDARIIVAGGRAMNGPEGFKLLERLAEKLGGAVAASRAAVDNGWISYPHQVGQTGQTVQADLYIACGISGQIQHLVGIQSCKTIVAIDIDDTTPMMKLADIAIKGDLFEVVPEIIHELEKRRV